MFLEALKRKENMTYTENGASTYRSTTSSCLDLFATIGALRTASEEEIVSRFITAYAEDADLALKTLFFARDVRGGLGERRVFKTILAWLAVNEPDSVRKNMEYVGEYGRYDDLMVLLGTPCEAEMLSYVKRVLEADVTSMKKGGETSLLAKWLPSVNASNRQTVKNAKKIARFLGMNDAQYRKMLSELRAYVCIIENHLRKKDYTFEYEKQPSKALYKYRKAFLRNDEVRYGAFLDKAEKNPGLLNASTLTPYDVVASVINKTTKKEEISEAERRSMDVTWKSLDNYVGDKNALAVVDGSGSMYWGGNGYLPAAVAQSLGIYFAEHVKGAFHGHFITFSENPRLVEVRGRDIVDKVRYCMSFNEWTNTDLMKTFRLILDTAVENHVSQKEMPSKLYVISDMEFDAVNGGGRLTNFEQAKAEFAAKGYRLPQVVFWNVASRNRQLPVTKNEQGVTLVSGCSPQIFQILSRGALDPYAFMMEVLTAKRYEKISA